MSELFRLDGKRALVTGAGSGIGAAIAKAFAESGAEVLVTDCKSDSAAATAQAIHATGGKAAAAGLDVTDGTAVEALAAGSGPMDIVVNNAGIGCVGTVLQTSGEDLDRMYSVNVRGVFNVSKAFLPGMISRGTGNFINLASVGGVVGIRDRLAYCTTKFAVVGLTKSMALDHAAVGIRVNCICPARVETPFVKARLQEYPDPEVAYREMSGTQLFGRMIAPEEIAAAAVYLASDASYMITGTAFMIDCGWTTGK